MLFEKFTAPPPREWQCHSSEGQTPRGSPRRLIEELLDLAGVNAALVRHQETGWASITFSGTRHMFDLRYAGCTAIADSDKLIEALDEHEFTIPGKLVADAAVTGVDHRMLPSETLDITLEILLLDEA